MNAPGSGVHTLSAKSIFSLEICLFDRRHALITNSNTACYPQAMLITDIVISLDCVFALDVRCGKLPTRCVYADCIAMLQVGVVCTHAVQTR